MVKLVLHYIFFVANSSHIAVFASDNISSSRETVIRGVPQGNILGPIVVHYFHFRSL